MVMGAVRSCYSVKAVIRPGRAPTWLHWYFADPCAGRFPHRHSFQTHGQFPKEQQAQAVGEQPGLRPYSKGFGPIGAPHEGVLWQGDLQWFIDGVPSYAGPQPLVCPVFLDEGLVALPPSWNTDDPLGADAFNPATALVAYLSPNDDGFQSYGWQAPDFASPGGWYRADWSYDGGGMRLSLVVNTGPYGHLSDVLHPSFVSLREGPLYWEYEYVYPLWLPLVSPQIVIRIGKCRL